MHSPDEDASNNCRCIQVGALVSGIFGMNLLNGVETAPGLFWKVSLAIIVGIFVITGTTLVYLYRRLRHTQVRL